MSHNKFVLLTTLLIQFGWILSQPADLGAFGTQNDIQTGIPTYSIPSQSERNLPSELYVLAFINYTYNGEIFNEEVAKFGEGPVPQIITGHLIHITTDDDDRNHTACSKNLRGTHGEPLPAKDIQWIALIKRGHCKFDEKVQNVIWYNAAAVIIYNDEDRKDLHKMRIEPQTRDIPAIFTHKEIGEHMAEILDTSPLTVSIVKGRLGKPIPNINRTSVLFVSISFIVLMIISFVWLVFYYVQRFRYLQTKDRKSRQLCTVAKRVIAKIPTKTFKSDDSNDSDSDCCAICIEPYKTTDVIRVLPCKHEFHKSCIDPWLLEHRTCPMCKLDCLKYYGFVVGAQNQIINLNNFNNQTASNQEPTAPPSSQLVSTTTAATTTTTTTTTTAQTTAISPTQHTEHITNVHNLNQNNGQREQSNAISHNSQSIISNSYSNSNSNSNSISNSNQSNNSHLDANNGGCDCKKCSQPCCRSHLSSNHNTYSCLYDRNSGSCAECTIDDDSFCSHCMMTTTIPHHCHN